MTQKKKFRNTVFGVLGAFTLAATPILAVSCSDSGSATTVSTEAADMKVNQLVKEYRSEFNNAAGGLYTDKELPKLKEIVQKYLDKANLYLYADLSIDGKIWLNSFIDELETKMAVLDSNMHYLIVDGNKLGFTAYNNDVAYTINWYVSKVNALAEITNPPAEGEKPATQEQIDAAQEDIKSYLQELDKYIDACTTNLTAGKTSNTTLSQVMLKHVMGNLLQYDFMSGIMDKFAEKGSKPSKAEVENVLPIQSTLATAEVASSNDKILQLIKFLADDYYPAVSYGGPNNTTNKTYTLNVVTNKPEEEDNGFVFKKEGESDKYIAGLGLTNDDLNTNDVGVGFTPNKENGMKIYNALLKVNSNTDKTAKQIFEIGYKGVDAIKHNMKEVAKQVAKVYVGENKQWDATVYYDEDSSGNTHESVETHLTNIVSADGTVDLLKFFKWLNSDQWFNGRDMTKEQFPTWDGTKEKMIVSDYNAAGGKEHNPNKDWAGRDVAYTYTSDFKAKNKGISSVKISDVIGVKENTTNMPLKKFIKYTKVKGDAGNLAYKYLDLGLSPATIQKSDQITNVTETNSISPEAAFVGTSHSIEQYLQYKDVSVQHFNGMFYNTSVDWTLRTGTGGAAYASSGAGSWSYDPNGGGGFYLDSNPYSGVQKWSMSTLATHESVSGHVYQFNYAHDHPSKSYAPSFRSTAYAEGWGLFSEWLAVQVGMYGEPQNPTESDRLPLPKFGVNSKNIDVKQFKDKYDYANGAYWVADDMTTTEKDEGNSQTLFDALQYFGFLNERQLRAMRCAIDVGLHAGGASIDNNGILTNYEKAGSFEKGTGWSLNQARTYLKSNSALGLDDIKRETKRYLGYTGQAVSYYNGLNVIEGLYMKAKNTFETSHGKDATFMNWANTNATNANTAPLFDIILRNGNVPIQVLDEAVSFFIDQNY